MNTDKDTTHRSSSYYSSSYKTKSGSSKLSLRVELAAIAQDPDLKQHTIVVQYFGKDAAARSGAVTPTELSAAVARLDGIDRRGVRVEFPSVSISKHTSYSRYRKHSTSTSGQHFNGIIINVLDDQNTLVSQYASNAALVKVASPTMGKMEGEAGAQLRRMGL